MSRKSKITMWWWFGRLSVLGSGFSSISRVSSHDYLQQEQQAPAWHCPSSLFPTTREPAKCGTGTCIANERVCVQGLVN